MILQEVFLLVTGDQNNCLLHFVAFFNEEINFHSLKACMDLNPMYCLFCFFFFEK